MKKKISKNDIFCIVILILCLIIIVTNRAIHGFSDILWIADIGTFFGILYSIYSLKHSILMYVFNLLSTLFVAATSFIQHLYFNAVFCIFVSAPLLISGIINWKKNEKTDSSKNLKSLSKKGFVLMAIAWVIAMPIIMFILWKLHSNLFYLDALGTSLCFVGLMLMSQMYYEQFYAFVIADVFNITMYLILTFQNLNNIVYLFLNTIYLIMSAVSLFNWKKLYKEQKQQIEAQQKSESATAAQQNNEAKVSE